MGVNLFLITACYFGLLNKQAPFARYKANLILKYYKMAVSEFCEINYLFIEILVLHVQFNNIA